MSSFRVTADGRPRHPHPGLGHGAGRLDPWSAAWYEHGPAYRARMTPPAHVSEGGCRRELLFCLLGGHGVSYELSMSAAQVLSSRGIFGSCERRDDRLQRYIQDLLGRPWYEPRRLDGEGRRYRYPKRKAALLRRADGWLRANVGTELLLALQEIDDERERRAWLCGCPGVGPKTASWVLRNVGLGDKLAILDVHILRAMEQAGRLGSYQLPRDYDHAEQIFLDWSAELGAPAAAFDLLLWELGRGDL